MYIKPMSRRRRTSRRWEADTNDVLSIGQGMGAVDSSIRIQLFRTDTIKHESLIFSISRTELESLLAQCRNFEERRSGSCNFPSTMGIADGADTS